MYIIKAYSRLTHYYVSTMRFLRLPMRHEKKKHKIEKSKTQTLDHNYFCQLSCSAHTQTDIQPRKKEPCFNLLALNSFFPRLHMLAQRNYDRLWFSWRAWNSVLEVQYRKIIFDCHLNKQLTLGCLELFFVRCPDVIHLTATPYYPGDRQKTNEVS